MNLAAEKAAEQPPASPSIADRAARLCDCLAELCLLDPALKLIEEHAGPLPYRSRPEGFAALIRTLVGQQLSPAAAEAIFRRLEACGHATLTPDYFLSVDDAELRAAGLSRPKIAYCRKLAEAVAAGVLSFEALRAMPDEAAIETLTALRGIGRWTAEIYLLFALGREDVWPAADSALRAAIMHLRGRETRPSETEMRNYGEMWRPHRGAAARLLWHYYGWSRRAGKTLAPL